MLLNVLIADDEYFLRQRLKKIIPWEEMSLSFAGEAANGLEILDILETGPIDILLLDIKMPRMDGLEVCEYIYHHYPEVRIIILSGYNDFEFARTTLRFRAMDYLLKPIDQSILSASLERCCTQIRMDKKEQLQLSKYRHYEKCSLLSEVMNHTLSWQNYCTAYPDFSQTHYSMYIAVYIHSDTDEVLQNLLEQVRRVGISCEYFKEMDYMYILQLFFQTQGEEETFQNLIPRFITQTTSYLFLYGGSPFPVEGNWPLPYRTVLRMLNCRYFHEASTVVYERDFIQPSRPTVNLSKIRETILYYVNSKEDARFMAYLDSLFHEISSSQDPAILPLIVTECFVTLGIHYEAAANTHTDIREYVSLLLDEEYRLDYVKNAVSAMAMQCIRQNAPTPSDVSLSNKIIVYIQENYADPDLSVSKVADHFSLNASYLSSLYKKINHVSLLQYITRIRLEHSKLLLKENKYKITNIAEMVGYSDVFYFSKRFKKTYGCSPKEYLLRSQ